MKLGYRRLLVVAIPLWVVLNIWIASDALSVWITYPIGGPDWTCERAFADAARLADCKVRDGLLTSYYQIVQGAEAQVYDMLGRIVLWPIAAWIVLKAVLWVKAGFDRR